MHFADAYLLKAGLRDKLIETEPYPDLKITVAIPVHNESGLERCLDSLFQCGTFASASDSASASAFASTPIRADEIRAEAIRAEVLILINASVESAPEILKRNLTTYDTVQSWIAGHPHPSVSFFVLLDHSFGKKEAGVGMARKILMDEAVRRFSSVDAPNGIIASLDADAVVEKNYLEAIVGHFKNHQPDGCSVYFEHPLSNDPGVSSLKGEKFGPEVYNAITQYELHLRYYLQSVRSTGYPFAYHTVGSSFAVRADVYCKEGGMNRRQAGEDFYFIQKIAQRGNFSECNETCVIPSPRPSDRVPFGTGLAVTKLTDQTESSHSMQSAQLTTYDPRPFQMLRGLFSGLDIMYTETALDQFMKSQPEMLKDFLETQQFEKALVEIRKNSATLPAFRKRYWRWFNMFRIMKFLHFARSHGYPDIPVGETSLGLLKQINPEGDTVPLADPDLKTLLMIYRNLERGGKLFALG